MLPESDMEEMTIEAEGSDRDFYIDFENKRIGGIIDGREALEQAVKIALITQRYRYPVFSHSYGTNYEGVLEEGYMKGMGRVKNAICDSLMCDERIHSVDSFEFERRGTKMIVKFKITSDFGKFEFEKEVG